MTLVITDLDNTLYDWVTYFSRSFDAMVTELEDLIDVEREQLLAEFKEVHQRYGNTEQPFAILELPSVQDAFQTDSREELVEKVDPCLKAFNIARKHHLKLYDSVEDTLNDLNEQGHQIVGHTEAIAINSYYRLIKLQIKHYFSHLYALDGEWKDHPRTDRPRKLEIPDEFVRNVPKEERKPNPDLLIDISNREKYSLDEVLYVGDSLTRDMSMAEEAGVRSVWAKYGKEHDPEDWDLLVQVTHWSPEDVEREERLKEEYQDLEPDHTINSFKEVIEIANSMQ